MDHKGLDRVKENKHDIVQLWDRGRQPFQGCAQKFYTELQEQGILEGAGTFMKNSPNPQSKDVDFEETIDGSHFCSIPSLSVVRSRGQGCSLCPHRSAFMNTQQDYKRWEPTQRGKGKYAAQDHDPFSWSEGVLSFKELGIVQR